MAIHKYDRSALRRELHEARLRRDAHIDLRNRLRHGNAQIVEGQYPLDAHTAVRMFDQTIEGDDVLIDLLEQLIHEAQG